FLLIAPLAHCPKALHPHFYTRIRKAGFRTLQKKHPDTLIVFISRVDGNRPEGRSAKTCLSDASVKVWVEGFRAMCKGRYQEEENKGKFFTIWETGAYQYWGEQGIK
ncbi:hypothetical protein EZS27_027434, partial [termite gut metagenome]